MTLASNAYSEAQLWLSSILDSSPVIDKQDFKTVIKRLTSLPDPTDPQNTDQFLTSGLQTAISQLSTKIGDASLKPDPSRDDGKLYQGWKQLTKLWVTCRPWASLFEISIFQAFIVAYSKTRAKNRILVEMAQAVRAAKIPSTAFQWNERFADNLDKTFAIVVGDAITTGDVDQVLRVIEASEAVGITLNKFQWGSFARQCRELKNGQLLTAIWQASAPARSRFTSQEWGVFAKAAGDTDEGDLLREVWTEGIKSKQIRDASTWGTFIRAAGQVADAELLEEVWGEFQKSGVVFDSIGWGTLAQAAGDADSPSLLTEVWKRWQESGKELSSLSWASFARAAGRTHRQELVEQIWWKCRASGVSLAEQTLGTFANAAGEVSQSVVFEQIWRTCQANGIELNSTTLRVLAIAAGRTHRDDLLSEIWEKWKTVGVPYDGTTWFSLAEAAGLARTETVLEDAWNVYLDNPISLDEIVWGSWVKAAILTKRKDLFNQIWSGWQNSGVQPSSAFWGRIAFAAGRTRQIAAVEDVWLLLRETGIELSAQGWTAIALAMAITDNGDLLSEVWTAQQLSNSPLDARGWAAFAHAAGWTNRTDILEELWTKSFESPAHTVEGLRSFANAARKTGNADLVKRIWSRYVDLGFDFNEHAIRGFVRASAGTGQPALLKEIFAWWKPQPLWARPPEFQTWISFFDAVYRLKDEDLLLQMFRRMETFYDPTRAPTRGMLNAYLSRLAYRLENKSITTEMTESLIGFRLDVTHCLTTLATEEPNLDYALKGGRFEGAARSLMRWLVNSYFRCDETEFQNRLDSLILGIQQLPRNQSHAWLAMICRGQESYSINLKSRFLDAFHEAFSSYQELTDQELIEEIRNGHLTAVIKEFLDVEMDRLATLGSNTVVELNGTAKTLLPLVEHVRTNQTDYMNKRKLSDNLSFFGGAAQIMGKVDLDALSASDWNQFLRYLIWTLSECVWTNLLEPLKGRVHSLKNNFDDEFRKPLTSESQDPINQEEYAAAARKFFRNFGNLLANYRFGELKPINIAYDVRTCLLDGRRDSPATNVTISSRTVLIPGWDGIHKDIIIPMLTEIRSNAEEGLRKLPLEDQLYRVMLERGEGEEKDYGVLTVTNAYEKGAINPYSTKRGLSYIQRMASLISEGSGAEYSTEETEDGRSLFTWRVFFPLAT